MNSKFEGNIIIAINALKGIMGIFLGPFLTAYFIKTSAESVVDLSIYYIFSSLLLGLGCFVVGNIIKRKFKIGMFRIGVITSFIYILTIIILKEKIIENLWLLSILYGISASAYWFPYNLFIINKIDNSYRAEYTVKLKNISSVIGILCPILLGTIITATNYELTAIIILVCSLIQIILSFILTPLEEHNTNKYSLKKIWNSLKGNKEVKSALFMEYLIGMNISDGALQTVMNILIFSALKTDMNLGIVTGIGTALSIICLWMYGKVYKNKNDNGIIIVSSIMPIVVMPILLIFKSNLMIVFYNLCYVVFTAIISLTRDIRLYNLSNSEVVGQERQVEFLAVREGALSFGRITSYTLLLIAGISGSELMLNLVMIILTLSIFATGLNIVKVKSSDK